MTPPKISIIINCKNGEPFLEDTFKALDKQDFTDFEVIFYDSESSDNSIEIRTLLPDDLIFPVTT